MKKATGPNSLINVKRLHELASGLRQPLRELGLIDQVSFGMNANSSHMITTDGAEKAAASDAGADDGADAGGARVRRRALSLRS